MRAHNATIWSVPTASLVLIGGAALVWLGLGPGHRPPAPLALMLGPLLVAGGLGLLVFAAYDRTRHDAADRKLHRYECTRCGYEAHLADVEHGDAYPCPTCGETVYE